MMEMSWEQLQELDRHYGDSFYLLDMQRFKRNYEEFLGAFRQIYPRTSIAYSYKTNYLPVLCKSVNEWGGYAEVVSGMEYELAALLGVEPGKIIFNGPFKSPCDMERALLSGSIVNLDSSCELPVVVEAAGRNREKMLHAGIRCNFELESEKPSRFGFDVEGDDFPRAVSALQKINNCRLAGIHCHFLTESRSPGQYRRMAEKMLEIAERYFDAGIPDFIDLGGGFFSHMEEGMEKQFPFPIPRFSDYAEAIASVFAGRYPGVTGPELILEPGMALAADVMSFVAKVVDVKRIRSRTCVLVSGSIYNIRPTKSRRNLPVDVIQKNVGDGEVKEVDIVGYTCQEDDVLYSHYRGSISPGDYCMFHHTGAYTLVLKPPFILPAPAVLTCERGDKEPIVVKRCEEPKDVFTTYTF